MSDDGHIDHAKLQTRYLVHYGSPAGPRFSSETHNAPWQAQRDALGYIQDGFSARIMRVTVGDDELPHAEWIDWPDPGLYRVHWRSGGSSLAAIGVTEDGGRWLAPTNWTKPSAAFTDWDCIEHLHRVDLAP